MKRLCNRFCNLMQLYATLLFLAVAAGAQEPPSPEIAQEESGAAATSVPPVLLRDVKLQTIGEERWLEELPVGLIFIDATTGKVMVADENDPHGRAVCTCRDIDWHSFTNTVRFNGHRLEYNQYWSQVAVLYRFGTNSWLRLVGDTSGSLANLTVDSYDPTNEIMVITADATDGAVLQVCTNLMEAGAWKSATNATVTAATDASTTWTIAMLGTDVEFYRVLAEVQREAGIHAEKPIHANAGIVMDGENWDHWPDVSGIASNAAAISNLQADVAANAGNIATNAVAVASVERRTGELEEKVDEYWCRWTTSSLSPTNTNWIPLFEDWPARNIWCCIYPGTSAGFSTNVVIAIPSNFTANVDCSLHIILGRRSNSSVVSLVTASGATVLNTTGSTAAYREWRLIWRADISCWVTVPYMFNGNDIPSYVKGDSTGYMWNLTSLPEDGTFAPVTEPAATLLSFSPAPSPSFLSPAALQPEEEPLDEPAFDALQDPETDR